MELCRRELSGSFAEMSTSTPFRDLLHAANLRHGTDGFTSSLSSHIRLSDLLRTRFSFSDFEFLDFNLDPTYRESVKSLSNYLFFVNPEHSAPHQLTAHERHGLLVVRISKLQESGFEDKKLHTDCNYEYGCVISCHFPPHSEISRKVTVSVPEHLCV